MSKKRIWIIKDSVIEEDNLWCLVEPDAVPAAKHALANNWDCVNTMDFIKHQINYRLYGTFGSELRGTHDQVNRLKLTIDKLVIRALANS